MNYLSSEPILYKLKTFVHNYCFPSHIVDSITKSFFYQEYTIQQPSPQLPSRPYGHFFSLSWLYIRQSKNEITNLTHLYILYVYYLYIA